MGQVEVFFCSLEIKILGSSIDWLQTHWNKQKNVCYPDLKYLIGTIRLGAVYEWSVILYCCNTHILIGYFILQRWSMRVLYFYSWARSAMILIHVLHKNHNSKYNETISSNCWKVNFWVRNLTWPGYNIKNKICISSYFQSSRIVESR